MSTYWEELAERYEDLTAPHPKALYGAELHARNESLKRLIGHAASAMPSDNPTALSWFISSLDRAPHKWFIARVMSSVSPLPSSMVEPLLVAALLEPNPSATRVFIEPCVRALGRAEVSERVAALVRRGVVETNRIEHVMYWITRGGA